MASAITKATQTQIQAAIDALSQSVSALTKQKVADVAVFAAQYGPVAALWGAQMASAQAAKDQPTVDKLQADLVALSDDVVLQAAAYGIDVQAATEKGLFAVIGAVAQAAKFFV